MYSLCGCKATLNEESSELRSCVKVEVAILGCTSLIQSLWMYSLCGCKATLNKEPSELRSCVKVEVAVLGSPSPTVLVFSVDVKQKLTRVVGNMVGYTHCGKGHQETTRLVTPVNHPRPRFCKNILYFVNAIMCIKYTQDHGYRIMDTYMHHICTL